ELCGVARIVGIFGWQNGIDERPGLIEALAEVHKMESMRSKRNTSQEDIDERDIAVSFDADFTDMPSDSGSMEVLTESRCSGNNEGNQSSIGRGKDSEEADEEIAQTEQVINAIQYYRRYGHSKLRHFVAVFRRLCDSHQLQLASPYSEHLKKMKLCIDQNQRVLKQILSYGLEMFGGDHSLQTAAEISQLRPASELYMSKVKSTLKQIVRDWSTEGINERTLCYNVVLSAIRARFPDVARRHDVSILVPGAGLGRLTWHLVLEGFSVQGNEFSLFMLFTSNFILNKCQKENEFTIYPYVLDTCNNWTYEDQIRPVQFPDLCPATASPTRANTFSMCAGDFLQTTNGDDECWSVVVTVFFIDTATNLMNYIDTIHRILKKGGVWINFGPLTYHFADMDDEDSIELPYSEVIRLVKAKGFKMERDERNDSIPPTFYA
uniref:carnosine N-methyltransferase n=1 Tax=Parascaris univalens TaxID=6257 RepID=A0A914ZRM2_PARUN